MATRCFHGSKPDPWIVPRPYSDPSARLRAYGPIRPMAAEPGFFRRLLAH